MDLDYTDKAIAYANSTINGTIPACEYVKLASQRFLNDLENEDWRWHYDRKRGNHVCAFIEEFIKHVKGKWAGKPLILEDWQCFVLINIYGWVDESLIRKHQTVILEIARKNGKSLFASAVAIYDLLYGEKGGEVYSLATKQEQAKICFDAAERMLKTADERVSDQFKVVTNQITNKKTWSKYKALSKDSHRLDGLNPTVCIFDEAAAVEDRNLFGVMTTAVGARDNYLMLYITTAQFNRSTAYYEKRGMLLDILRGEIDDDRIFGLVYTIDKDDDWMDEDVWIKANPGLDVSVSREFLQNQVKEATTIASEKNNVLTKHFNVWTSSEQNWIDQGYWLECDGEVERKGDLYIGMDLSHTRDLTALCYMWNNGDQFSVDFQCFLPQRIIREVPPHKRELYHQAVKSGVLLPTSGDVVDYREVRNCIKDMASRYNLKMIGYDQWNSSILVNELEDMKLPTLDIGQNMKSLSAASKEAERLIIEQKVVHNSNPFINWQLECCITHTDVNGNIKVKKEDADKSAKIDAIIAMIMCMSMAAGKLEQPKNFGFAFGKL